MATKEELQAQAAAVRDALWKIEAAELAEAGKALVGKYFTYRNCYSCPKTEADYWPLYLRIDGCDKDGVLRGVSFQTDSNGDVRVEYRMPSVRMFVPPSGYKPSSRRQFNAAFARLINKLKSQATKPSGD